MCEFLSELPVSALSKDDTGGAVFMSRESDRLVRDKSIGTFDAKTSVEASLIDGPVPEILVTGLYF